MEIVPTGETEGEVMIRMIALFTLLTMSFTIIYQLTEDLTVRELEDGLDELINEYCEELNNRLKVYHGVFEE